MFNFLSVKERLRNEQKKNAALEAKQEKTEALLAYTAMMADVDLPDEGEEVSDDE